MHDRLSIELVDRLDRAVVVLNSEVRIWTEKDAEKAILARVNRWRQQGAVGGYARNSDGDLIAYH